MGGKLGVILGRACRHRADTRGGPYTQFSVQYSLVRRQDYAKPGMRKNEDFPLLLVTDSADFPDSLSCLHAELTPDNLFEGVFRPRKPPITDFITVLLQGHSCSFTQIGVAFDECRPESIE